MEAGVLNSPPERRQVPVNAREDPSPPVQHHCWEHPIRQHRAVRRPPKRRVSPAGEQLSPANRSGAGRLIPGLSFSCRDALSPPYPPPLDLLGQPPLRAAGGCSGVDVGRASQQSTKLVLLQRLQLGPAQPARLRAASHRTALQHGRSPAPHHGGSAPPGARSTTSDASLRTARGLTGPNRGPAASAPR